MSDDREVRRVPRRAAARFVTVVTALRFGMRTTTLTLRRASTVEGQNRIFDAAAELLLASGFHEAVCRQGTPLAFQLAARGISQPPVDRVAQHCVAEAALFALGMTNAQSVGLYAHRRTRELDRTVALLAPKVRSLAVVIQRGGDNYPRELMYDYGLSVMSSSRSLAACKLKVLFDAPGFSVGEGFSVGATPPPTSGLKVAADLRYSLPARLCGSGYPPLELASAAIKHGALRAGEIAVVGLRFTNSIDNH